MVLTRLVALALAIIAGGAPASASVTVIHALNRDQLLGESTSAADVNRRIAANESRLAMAGAEIGLSSRELQQFLHTFRTSRPEYVQIPRHLDAMTAVHRSGNVYVLHNVIIPAGSRGWEVDLHEPHQLVRLFMPATCGNLSVIRTPVVQHIAARPPLPPRHIETAAATPPPTPAPVAEATPEAFPPPPHHNGGIFVLLGGLILTLIGSGGGPGPGPVPVPGPPPNPATCPPVDAVQSADCSGAPPQ